MPNRFDKKVKQATKRDRDRAERKRRIMLDRAKAAADSRLPFLNEFLLIAFK